MKLSRYQRSLGHVSDNLSYEYNEDVRFSEKSRSLEFYKKNHIHKVFLMLLTFIRVIGKYDIFHFYFSHTFLPYGLDLPFLKMLGKKSVMSYCGSDIRLVSKVERNLNPYVDLLKTRYNDSKYETRKILAMKWQSLWIDKFTACRNTYESAVYAIPSGKIRQNIWLNNTGVNHLAKGVNSVITHDPPLIVHAPTDKDIKGTRYFLAALKNIREKGIEFKYEKITDLRYEDALERYKKSDIILDQLLVGAYGSFAVEGMALGKPVICYLIEEVKEKHFADCPIWNANIDNIEEKLTHLILDSDLRVELGKRGMDYVNKYHNDITINEELINVYKSL